MKIKACAYTIIFASLILFSTSGCKKADRSNTNDNAPIIFNSGLTYGSLTDQSGNTYKTITISTQTWMAENLRTTKFRNGDAIPNVSDGNSWKNQTSAASCDLNNNSNNSKYYGKLYNFYTITDSRNIAPTGWHIATTDEWNTMVNYLGGWSFAGDKLKEMGTTHWADPNSSATNSTGFTALPGSSRNDDGSWGANGIIGLYGTWWSNSGSATTLYSWNMDYNTANVVSSFVNYNTNGYAVRCVKDN